MDSRKKNKKFEKNLKKDYIEQNEDLLDSRQIKINKLKTKFNLSANEADVILLKIEEKKQLNNTQKRLNNQSSSNVDLRNINGSYSKKLKVESVNNKNVSKTPADSQHSESSFSNNNQKQTANIESTNSNVDSILDEIIPEYNNQISIELRNVNLIFDVVEDKIDTIKESFIRAVARNKGKKYKFHALKDITFKIYQGEKIGIIGYNGAGKSTLLNVIAGIYHPNSGYIKTHGKISPLLSLGAGFDPNYSGRNNILLNGAVLGYDKQFLMDKMDEIIEFSELGKFIDLPIKNYSSGMLAKLGFSIATAVNPDILIIDEILAVGDVSFQKKSSDKIRSLMDGGTTVILVSHSIPQIRALCDKAIWVDDGKIREMGEVNKVCDNYLKDAEKASKNQLYNIQFR